MSASGNKKDRDIHSLAVKIVDLMRRHPDRNEAIDAHFVARILFRKGSKNHSLSESRQSCS